MSVKKNYFLSILVPVCCVLMLLLFPGCSQVMRWGKEQVPQIKKIQFRRSFLIPYLKSTALYDSFILVISVDAIYLSSTVRLRSIELTVERNGLSEAQHEQMRKQAQEEVKQTISFYVLLPYTINITRNSPWSFHLGVGDRTYAPLSIKKVDLSPEYRRFFGLIYTRFKTPYLLTFTASDGTRGKLTEQGEPLRLQFNNGEFHGELLFDTSQVENVE